MSNNTDNPVKKKKISRMTILEVQERLGHAIQNRQQNSKYYQHLQIRLKALQQQFQVMKDLKEEIISASGIPKEYFKPNVVSDHRTGE